VLWARSLNEIGTALGGGTALIDLSLESLEHAAGALTANRVDAELLITALRQEARLSAVGALFARAELLRAIRGQRALLDFPDALPPDQDLLFIIGPPRSGTATLLQALACFEEVRAPLTTELLYPQLVGHASASDCASVTLQDRLWDAVDPGFHVQHLNDGALPAECLPILACGFQSHHWTGCYGVPTYAQHLRNTQCADALLLHRRFATRLAESTGADLLVFKSPSHWHLIDGLARVYPSSRFVLLDRPLESAIASYARLLMTIRRMRSAHVETTEVHADAEQEFREGLGRVEQAIQTGTLSVERIRRVDFSHTMQAPLRSARAVLQWAGHGPSDSANVDARPAAPVVREQQHAMRRQASPDLRSAQARVRALIPAITLEP
jgi:hypothetical protein